jgi:hypothetical protein
LFGTCRIRKQWLSPAQLGLLEQAESMATAFAGKLLPGGEDKNGEYISLKSLGLQLIGRLVRAYAECWLEDIATNAYWLYRLKELAKASKEEIAEALEEGGRPKETEEEE